MKAVYNNAGVKVPGMYEKGGATETKKDSCYYKAKAAHKVFPSAYASGMIAKCRKK